MLDCKISNVHLILINVYCQTKDNPSGQNNLYDYIHDIIDSYSDRNIILGGDLITYLNYGIDKKGGRIEKQSVFSQNINYLCKEFSLIDIWRIRNPNTLKFTIVERSKNGIVQSRLDYWLVSLSLAY